MKWREAIWKRQAGCDNKGTGKKQDWCLMQVKYSAGWGLRNL